MHDAPIVPEIRGLCPLLQVFDMPRSLAFYRDLLGFEVVEWAPPGDSCDWAWLRRGRAEIMLNTQFEGPERPAFPAPDRKTAHGDTCLFLGTPELDAMYAYLRSRGIPVDPPVVRPYGMKQLSLQDPDGYGICFQWSVARPDSIPS